VQRGIQCSRDKTLESENLVQVEFVLEGHENLAGLPVPRRQLQATDLASHIPAQRSARQELLFTQDKVLGKLLWAVK
jgi:hypothetical protein